MTLADPVPDKAKEAVSPLYGVVDVLRRDRIAGWVIDRRDPGASVTVEIRREGQRIASVPANRRRRDLEANRFGSGLYGFGAAIDPPLMEGMEFTVSVRAMAADGTEAILQPLSRVLEPSGEQRLWRACWRRWPPAVRCSRRSSPLPSAWSGPSSGWKPSGRNRIPSRPPAGDCAFCRSPPSLWRSCPSRSR